MFAQERHRAIQAIVSRKGRLTIGELARHLGASTITTRRDLRLLAAEGKIVRTHGGVLHPDALKDEPAFEAKAVEAMEAKVSLARRVVAELPERGQVFIDSGTTCLEVGRLVLDRRDLTIVTNSLPLLQLGAGAKARVVAIGGEIRPVSLALIGDLALDWLKHLRFQVAVIGASGIDPIEGPSTTELSEAAVKQLACDRATKRILVAHAAKWGAPAAITFAGWKRFNLFVTDARIPRSAELHLRGVSVQVTKP